MQSCSHMGLLRPIGQFDISRRCGHSWLSLVSFGLHRKIYQPEGLSECMQSWRMLEQSEYVRKILISFVLYRSSGESFATKSSIANYVHHVNVIAGEDAVSYLCKPA
jgi:hypothetical protein